MLRSIRTSLAVSDTIAAGISWRVSSPKTRRIDVIIQLKLIGGVEVSEVKAAVESAVRTYIDNIRVNDGNGGSDLIYSELTARTQDSEVSIIDSIIDLRLDGTPVLQTNISVKVGERLISGSISIS